jgi:adenine deaminase
MYKKITGNIVDIINKEIFFGEVVIELGKIKSIQKLNIEPPAANTPFILPGFIDSHVHIESSMLVPSEFAKLAVVHGTVATISDPHEIANVCGLPGVQFMIDNGKTVPFKFHFGAPSCVPATIFETAGATLNSVDVEKLLAKDDIFYLSEVMNFPGVLQADEELMKKIVAAKKYHKPVDGHAPGLMGELAKKYIDAGITTDHECVSEAEALEKLKYGMKILIREGSAAKNFDALINLMHIHFENMMFCSDDKHPDSLVVGHINQLCERAVGKGIDVFKVLQAACINPVLHYNMKVGLLKQGDAADFIVVDNLTHFKVLQTYINGDLVAENGRSLIDVATTTSVINQFNCTKKNIDEFKYPIVDITESLFAIEALDGQLITHKINCQPTTINSYYESNVEKDFLKIVVVNRYTNAPIAKSFIKNFKLTQGAIASSVAHDSHNIVAVGVDDESLMKAVNAVIAAKGGLSAVSKSKELVLPLPIGGLMSNLDGYQVAKAYTALDKMAKEDLGGTLGSPFMTLSFMALLVIPQLKLSDKGLFDVDTFSLI